MDDSRSVLGVDEGASLPEIRKAYRALARKWHPDRFPEGPERAWAEQKMIDINRAYNECTVHCAANPNASSDGRFAEVRMLIDARQLSQARRVMRDMTERDAEWNFHFGLLLYERHDFEKASVYFSIAHRQDPENVKYTLALENADSLISRGKVFSRLKGILQKRAYG